jgi:hypothetical protein
VFLSDSTSLKLLIAGTGSPESAVTRGVGTVYVQTDASPATDAIWYKATGSGNTGWVQVTASSATDAELAAIAGLTSAANKGITFTGSGTAATFDLTAFALTLLDDANQGAAQTTLGVVPGTHVQAFDADLSALAGLTSAADKGIQFTGSGTAATYDLTTFAKTILDDANQATAQATLGVVPGTHVVTYNNNNRDVIVPLVVDGGGSVITTGIKHYAIEIPFSGTIVEWRLFSDLSCTAEVDVWSDAYANYPPDGSDSIWGGTEPATSGGTKAEGTGLAIAVSAGAVWRVNVNANDNAKWLGLMVKIRRT